ncbi:unnamed protein product [Phytophthora fragariaefolia]|uniref:Unnamed protein product n=1 Tax=Phytophthora fragariaefolia TaxID=1490495 RepID=A0A9W6Y8G4_9STRA|nr:unnamed protein product [Phytophthora fragariaefolia]
MGMNESVLFEAVDDLSEFLADLLSEVVRFPDTMAEWRRIEQQFRCKRGFPGVVGAVDGSLIATQRPTDFNGFYCRKNYPAINVQGIVDADQKFMAIDINAARQKFHSFEDVFTLRLCFFSLLFRVFGALVRSICCFRGGGAGDVVVVSTETCMIDVLLLGTPMLGLLFGLLIGVGVSVPTSPTRFSVVAQSAVEARRAANVELEQEEINGSELKPSLSAQRSLMRPRQGGSSRGPAFPVCCKSLL